MTKNQPEVSSKKVLYIEDTESSLELMRQILSYSKKLVFIPASNGLDGIEIAQNERPDLILLDIKMQTMDGLVTFNLLQSKKETASIPVIAVSANAMTLDINIALEMGFKHYITKPIDINNLITLIETILFPKVVRPIKKS